MSPSLKEVFPPPARTRDLSFPYLFEYSLRTERLIVLSFFLSVNSADFGEYFGSFIKIWVLGRYLCREHGVLDIHGRRLFMAY